MTKAGPFTDFERSSDGGHIATGAMEKQKFSLPKPSPSRFLACHRIGSAAESELTHTSTPTGLP